MANYNSIKNAALIAPTTNPDLGSATNRYGNVYLSGNVNIAGTSITSTALTPKIASIGYIGDDTAADIAGGQIITLNGTGFQDGASILISGTVVSVVTFIGSSQLTFTSPTMAAGSYVIYVINPDGGTALSIPGIQYSGTPAWTTNAGALTGVTSGASVSLTVAATGDAPVTYSLYSGALPTGVTLNSTSGFISGTAPTVSNNTTYNFTIRATDAQKQDTNRSFSLLVSTAPPAIDYLVIGGGGGASGLNTFTGPGGGAGGYRSSVAGEMSGGGASAESSLTLIYGTPYTITIGAGGTGGSYLGITSGGNSTFSTITSIGGGRSAYYNAGAFSGLTGGSGGGGYNVAGGGGNAGQNGSGTANQGYAGGTATTYGSTFAAGGGGGAGGVGGTTLGQGKGGVGGIGVYSSITGSSVGRAGGGGGSTDGAGSYVAGTASEGGGAAKNNGASGTSGTPNTGGGGGGAGTFIAGGSGGSGVVIIRVANTVTASATTGSPTVTTPTGYRVYTFTTSGSITF